MNNGQNITLSRESQNEEGSERKAGQGVQPKPTSGDEPGQTKSRHAHVVRESLLDLDLLLGGGLGLELDLFGRHDCVVVCRRDWGEQEKPGPGTCSKKASGADDLPHPDLAYVTNNNPQDCDRLLIENARRTLASRLRRVVVNGSWFMVVRGRGWVGRRTSGRSLGCVTTKQSRTRCVREESEDRDFAGV